MANLPDIWTPASGLAPQNVPVTALVLTLNEIENIARCLSSLGWAAQVLVVDSGSTDGTQEAAQRMGAEVVFHEFADYGAQRNWAIRCDEVAHEWIFVLDADEWVSADLAKEVAEVVRSPLHKAYETRLRFIFLGTWIRFAGWYRNSEKVVLLRSDSGAYEGAHSERFNVDGTLGHLAHDVIDQDLQPFDRWLAKHNTYSTLIAEQRLALRGKPLGSRVLDSLKTRPRRRIAREFLKRAVLPSLPAKPLVVFIYMYVLRGGFLHGRVGLWFCLLHAYQEINIDIKVAEVQRQRKLGASPSGTQGLEP